MQKSQKLHNPQISIKRVVNNTVISLIGQIITWASTIALTIAYGRFLGDSKFGELYLAINFVGLIGFPLEASFNTQLTRDVAQQPEKAHRYLTNILLLKGILWVGLYALILCICWLLGYNAEERLLVGICGVTLLCSSTVSTFASLHYAYERSLFPVVGTILEKGLSALLAIFLLRQGAGVETMALVLLAGSFISLLWQASWFFRLVGVHFIFDMGLTRKLLQTSVPFVVYGILGVIYYRIDTFILSLMTNTAVIGWYGAGYRLFDTMVFLPSLIIGTIMSPVFSKLSVSSEKSLKLAIEKSTNFLLICGIPIATVLIVAAPNIIGFLYHRPEFVHTIPVLQGLAPGLVCLYLNTIATTVLISSNQEKKITILAVVALVFNLGLNLILIPLYQQVGAAVVTSLTELLLLCVSIVLVPRHLLPLNSLKVGAKALLASIVMAVAILLVNELSIFALLSVAAVVYLIAATILCTIPKEDILVLYGAVSKKALRAAPAPRETQQEVQQEIEEELQQEVQQEIYIAEQRENLHSAHPVQYISEGHIHSPVLFAEEDDEITVKRPTVKRSAIMPEVSI